MFFTEVDERQFAVKPMNCPSHCLIFGTRLRSYRDLPIRFADFGRLHRYERSGVTTGLFRVRSFCAGRRPHLLHRGADRGRGARPRSAMILEIYRTFGFDERRASSCRPARRSGSARTRLWDRAEGALAAALGSAGIAYQVNPGDGAFYGPKIDFHVARRARPELAARHRPARLPAAGALRARLHRGRRRGAPAGDDPPRDARLARALHGDPHRALRRRLPALARAGAGRGAAGLGEVRRVRRRRCAARWRRPGVRVELDDRNEKLGYKIREAQLQKIPFMLVVGARGSRRKERCRCAGDPARIWGRCRSRPSIDAWSADACAPSTEL